MALTRRARPPPWPRASRGDKRRVAAGGSGSCLPPPPPRGASPELYPGSAASTAGIPDGAPRPGPPTWAQAVRFLDTCFRLPSRVKVLLRRNGECRVPETEGGPPSDSLGGGAPEPSPTNGVAPGRRPTLEQTLLERAASFDRF